MSSGLAVASVALAPPARAAHRVSLHRYPKRTERAGRLVRRDTVRFTGRRVEIAVVALQRDKPDTSSSVHRRVDPTLIVPAGATLRFLLANADGGMAHGLEVTLRPSPYPRQPALPLSPSHPARAARRAWI